MEHAFVFSCFVFLQLYDVNLKGGCTLSDPISACYSARICIERAMDTKTVLFGRAPSQFIIGTKYNLGGRFFRTMPMEITECREPKIRSYATVSLHRKYRHM